MNNISETLPDPYAAYGRVLLYHLTGEKIEPALPEVTPRSRKIGEKEFGVESYSISPNPTSDFLSIVVTNSTINANYGYEIINVTGVSIYNGNIQKSEKLDISHLASGMYIAKVTKNDQTVAILKFIVNR